MSGQKFFRSLLSRNRWPGLVWNDLLYLPERKIIFASCSKNASSKIKFELYRMENGVDPPPETSPHNRLGLGFKGPGEYGFDEFYRAIFDPEVTKFTIFREPWSRIVSCYTSRFATYHMEKYDNRSYTRDEWLPNRQDAILRLGGSRTPELAAISRHISLSDFITYVVEQPEYHMDRHWYPQTSSLFVDDIPYDLIGTVENVGAVLTEVAKRTGADHYTYSGARLNASRKSVDVSSVGAALRSRFEERFSRDFEFYERASKIGCDV